MTHSETCRAHQRYHCIDCGYRWYTVDAAATGWYVRQWDDPETVPLTNIYGHTFLLGGDGRVDL